MKPKPAPVQFILFLKKVSDGEKVKKIVSKLGVKEVTINNLSHSGLVILVCRTNQKNFEKIFKAKLDYVEERVPNLNHAPKIIKKWNVIKEPCLPTCLTDTVAMLTVDQPVVLTD